MRPINKGNIPLNANGQPIVVTKHTEWRGYLIDRIGGYCSYCEIKLNDLPQVEHVVAKVLNPALILDWDNLLLACGACNRKKNDNPCTSLTHYLPDKHNTYLAFTHHLSINSNKNNEPAVFVIVNTIANPPLPNPHKATATINLCGLNIDTTRELLKVADLRWRYRHEALLSALLWKKNWQEWGHTKADKFIPLLITVVISTGFFSIWFYFFQEERRIREELVNSFTGTARTCFDADFNPIWRNAPLDI